MAHAAGFHALGAFAHADECAPSPVSMPGSAAIQPLPRQANGTSLAFNDASGKPGSGLAIQNVKDLPSPPKSAMVEIPMGLRQLFIDVDRLSDRASCAIKVIEVSQVHRQIA